MPCAATALANSTVYYKGNKEPWDWLVRQFIYISCSIFIYLKMINSAEAPPSSQSAGLTLAQRLRARRWLAGRLIRSRRGTGRLRGGLPVGVGAAGTGGSSAGALGSLPERQRVGDLRAAVVSPLQEGGHRGKMLILASAPTRNPPASPAGVRYPLASVADVRFGPPRRKFGAWLFYFFLKHLRQEHSASGPCEVPDGLEEQVIASDGAVQKRLRTRRGRRGLQKAEFCASQKGFRTRSAFEKGWSWRSPRQLEEEKLNSSAGLSNAKAASPPPCLVIFLFFFFFFSQFSWIITVLKKIAGIF